MQGLRRKCCHLIGHAFQTCKASLRAGMYNTISYCAFVIRVAYLLMAVV